MEPIQQPCDAHSSALSTWPQQLNSRLLLLVPLTTFSLRGGGDQQYLLEREQALHPPLANQLAIARMGQDCTTLQRDQATKSTVLTFPHASFSCFSDAACFVFASLTILCASWTRKSFSLPVAAPSHTVTGAGQSSAMSHALCKQAGVDITATSNCFTLTDVKSFAPQNFPEKGSQCQGLECIPFPGAQLDKCKFIC